MGFTRFYWVFSGFYWVALGSTGFLMDFSTLQRNVLGFTAFCLVGIGFDEV